jgi:predicted DNA-binding ribbon-helix-helix protein
MRCQPFYAARFRLIVLSMPHWKPDDCLFSDFSDANWGRSMKSLVVRHSVAIDGQKSSICLEDAFWTALKEIAHERHESVAHLINSINATRQSGNLSSVLRVFILEYYLNWTAVSLVPDVELISS